MSSKIKNILILVAVAIVLVLVYIFFIKKGPTEATLTSTVTAGDSTTVANTASSTSEISKDFINVLLSVKSIKLDDSILSDQAFLSLKDSTITLIQVGDEGRLNPFAPINSETAVEVPTADQSLNDKVSPVESTNTTSDKNTTTTGKSSTSGKKN